MWEKKVAHILNLIAHQPNRRPHPADSCIEVFDGGQILVMTGYTRYEFQDGSIATHALQLPWEPKCYTIKLATGEEIFIKLSPTETEPLPEIVHQPMNLTEKTEESPAPTLKLVPCRQCQNLKVIGERYCRYCGQDSKTDSK